jgi:cyanate lyase
MQKRDDVNFELMRLKIIEYGNNFEDISKGAGVSPEFVANIFYLQKKSRENHIKKRLETMDKHSLSYKESLRGYIDSIEDARVYAWIRDYYDDYLEICKEVLNGK